MTCVGPGGSSTADCAMVYVAAKSIRVVIMNKERQRYFYDNMGFILSYRCYSAYVLLTTGPHTRGGQHKVYIRRHVGEPRFTMLEVWEVLPLSLHNWVTSSSLPRGSSPV